MTPLRIEDYRTISTPEPLSKLSLQLKEEIRVTKRHLEALQRMLVGVQEVEVKTAKKTPPVPPISKAIWLHAIGHAPQPLGQIVDEVMRRLSIDASHRRRVVQRCVVYLNGAIKAGDIIKQGPVGNQTYRRPPIRRGEA